METPDNHDICTKPIDYTQILYDSDGRILDNDGKLFDGVVISETGFIRVESGISTDTKPFPGTLAPDNTIKK